MLFLQNLKPPSPLPQHHELAPIRDPAVEERLVVVHGGQRAAVEDQLLAGDRDPSGSLGQGHEVAEAGGVVDLDGVLRGAWN